MILAIAFRLGKFPHEAAALSLREIAWCEAWLAGHDDERPGGRADRRVGMIAATLANLKRDPDQTPPWNPENFIGLINEPPEQAGSGPETGVPEDLFKAAVQGIARRTGGNLPRRQPEAPAGGTGRARQG